VKPQAFCQKRLKFSFPVSFFFGSFLFGQAKRNEQIKKKVLFQTFSSLWPTLSYNYETLKLMGTDYKSAPAYVPVCYSNVYGSVLLLNNFTVN